MRQRIRYVANARLPSDRAHSYQIVQMTDSFAAVGADITLTVPDRRGYADDFLSLEEYYDTPIDFEYEKLPCVDFLYLAKRVPDPLPALFFYLQVVTFALSAVLRVVRRDGPGALIYSRALFFSCLVSFLPGYRVVHEVHDVPESEWRTTLVGLCMDRMHGVVPISEGLRDDWAAYTTVDMQIEPDGVQLEKFVNETEPSRKELGVPADARLVTYAGSLLVSKGVDTLVSAMRDVPDDVHLCLVGGDERQRAGIRAAVGEFPDNVTAVGHVRPERVPPYLHASDVLAVPNSAQHRRSARYTSPLKLFEYMAAGRPIVASDVPAHREILDESMAYLFEPDDANDLAEAIERALAGPESDERVRRAREAVKQYSWESRAKSILERFGT